MKSLFLRSIIASVGRTFFRARFDARKDGIAAPDAVLAIDLIEG